MADELVNVPGDTIEEFLDNAVKKIAGDAHEIGDCTAIPDYKAKTDGKKITSIEFSIDITVRRAHWSGGKADKRHEKAIKLAESLNEGHEDRHRKLAETISAKAFKAAGKNLIGKTTKEADAVITAVVKDIKKAFKALDAKEGMVYFDDDENKDVITVKLKGA